MATQLHYGMLSLVNFFNNTGRMERQRREDELKNRSSKKPQDADQPMGKRVRQPKWILIHTDLFC